MKYTRLIISSFIFGGCISFFQGPPQTLAEVEFEGAKFGLEYIPDPSLEGYNQTYYVFYKPRGAEKRKYILKPEDGFLRRSYPVDPSILNGIPVIMVDSVNRVIGGYGPTEAATTLFMDPQVFDRDAFDTFVRFVNQSYQNPDTTNQFLLWMNKATNVEDKPDTLYLFDSVFAIVYKNPDDLEPQYVSGDGKRKLKLGMDHYIDFIDVTEKDAVWVNAGRVEDSVFYYYSWYGKSLQSFASYSFKGKRFGSLYNRTQVQQ